MPPKKGPFISKGFFSLEDEFDKGFEEHRAGRQIPIKDKEKLVAIARKLRITMNTSGWKEVIGPFLERRGNPAMAFSFFDKDPKKRATEEEVMLCKAFWQFLNYVNNTVRLGERLIIDLENTPEQPSRKPRR